MPRPLRFQAANAIYHVINRGNYRAPIFATVGAKKAFLKCIEETADRFDWRVHAFSIMINHFHLAIQTRRLNLCESVHWLESTFGTRFNRFRDERGHLFQGRYKSFLVEPGRSLATLVNYIHLNPVKKGLVTIDNLARCQWTSLRAFLSVERPDFLACADWLAENGLPDNPAGWKSYQYLLRDISLDPKLRRKLSDVVESETWALGSESWKAEKASEFKALLLPDLPFGPERDALRELEWNQILDEALARIGRSRHDLVTSSKYEPWKLSVADYVRRKSTATAKWLTISLFLGAASSLRTYLCDIRAGRRSIDQIE